MKKIIFAIFAFVIVFNFAAKIPAVSAAEEQPNQIDAKDVAYLAQTFTALHTLLDYIELRLASPVSSQLLDKEAVSASLVAIRSNLLSINGTLAVLESKPTVAKAPVAAPKVSAPQAGQPPVAAMTNDKTPGTVLEITLPPVTEVPTANSEAVPQTAQASESFDYRKLVWLAVFTVIGIAIISLWLFRKDNDRVMEMAQTAGVAIRSFDDESKLPVELPAESLFPSRTEFAVDNKPQVQPVVYSPLRSVVYPHPTDEQKFASLGKFAIHPPTIQPRVPKEKPSEKNADISGIF